MTNRSCIFCGGLDLTKEDAWPNWLVSLVGRQRINCTQYRSDGSIERSYPNQGLRTRVGYVCADCNNGWMSRLENRAKPVLEPMVLGQATVLEAADQIVVVEWAVKTAMVFEWVQSTRTPFFTFAEREALAVRGSIPSDLMVLAGAFAGSAKATFSPGRSTLTKLGGESLDIPAIWTTLTVGGLMLAVEKDRYRETTGRTGWVMQPRPHFHKTVLLGTASRIDWPPRGSFNDQSLKEFIRRTTE